MLAIFFFFLLVLFQCIFFNLFSYLGKKIGIKHVKEEVYELLSQAAQERIRNIIDQLIIISKHRDNAITAKTRVEILSNTKRYFISLVLEISLCSYKE